ncbi:hypothetical protein FACS1894142_4940 [Spirochaetia bacterium]|nr:hypothetical protein FACS1894142_4940 [Spirochaetia bacterium]
MKHGVFQYRPAPVVRALLCCALVSAVIAGNLSALSIGSGFLEGLTADFLWSGSWEEGKNLIDRGDIRLHALDFTLRGQLIDKRPATFWEQFPESGNTALSGGLYHDATGSRLLYGILDEAGLAARIRNPWAKSVPYVEAHRFSLSDLKTEPSSTKTAGTYLYLGSPRLGMFRGFASVLLDSELNPGITGGLDAQFDKKTNLRMEGFYTGWELPPRTASAWFSERPPLPERDFGLSALNITFTSPFISAAADTAYSETFAYGRGLYGNLALRFDRKPWQLSLAADAAGDRYVDRDGTGVGAGFRTAGKLEWRGQRTSLFRVSTTLRSPGLGEPFDRGSGVFYYRFPLPAKGKAAGSVVDIRRVSLTLNRNAADRAKILDSAEGVLGVKVGPVQTVMQGTLTGKTAAPDDAAAPFPYPVPTSAWDFYSFKVSGELSYAFSPFQFKAKMGYTNRAEKAPIWDTAFNGSIRGKPGRIGLEIASPDFPNTWTCTLSWRFEI